MTDDKLQLYLAHRAALLDYASPIVGCRARAEDVVQEAWLRFSRHDDSTEICHPASYLYRIVRNLALDHTRRMATEKAQPGGDELLAELPSSTASPETTVTQQNELAAIGRALETLPARTRLAFEMHRLGGFTLQQVAAHLNVSVSLVHQLVHDALRHCMAHLEDEQ
ncbi:sigma-70 family RNA polymerase sigma factor [Pseudomonas sp. S75]|uniref:sigma-70 family RNA polymerase sigma factor n=1 Tax=unclassified Pseudomonas TaxID=196821 RepID=UPI0019087AD1|nr:MULTISPECIES: sigma-70 family RNA polymerase sigma factor [unclassified Pseudomonas]MBJ9974439.1 sigma-70 family RNA polymerase sigma factor [Pseudomonas sp. S30]MBK0154252.1 sigma-70 family RNA polymerase sigma factor [Pseudomonas sp. S75]